MFTSFLHEDEQLIQELLAVWVTVQFVELWVETNCEHGR